MSKSKGTMLAIRLTDEEKEQLEKKVKKNCMGFSQYISNKVLESDDIRKGSNLIV